VAEHREVAALMAQTGAPAPEGLWDRIVGSLEEAPPKLRLEPRPAEGEPTPESVAEPPEPVQPGAAGRAQRRWGWRVAGGALAAAAAIVVVALALNVRDLQHRVDRADESGSLQAAATSALAAPGSRFAALRTSGGEQQAVAVVEADGQGYLIGSSLPALDDRVYQLWGQQGGKLISLGVLGSHPDVVAFSAAGPVEALAITSERAPVVQSTQTPLVTGKLA
jgi:hypothetical protein